MKFKMLILSLLSISLSSAFGQTTVQEIISTDFAAPSYKVFEEKVLPLIEAGKKLESLPVTSSNKAAADNLYRRLLTFLEVYQRYSPTADWRLALSEAYDLLDNLSQKFSLQSHFEPILVNEVAVEDSNYLKNVDTLRNIPLKGAATQTEAFLKRPNLRAEVLDSLEYQEIPQNLVLSAISKEREHASYDVFYHAEATIYALFQDIVTEVLKYAAQSKADSPFYYLRIPGASSSNEILSNLLKKGFSIDHDPRIRNLLLSVNLSLFGNAKDESESTMQYFLDGTSINSPYGKNPRSFIAGVVADLGLIIDLQFVDQLTALYEKYLISDTGSLLQIFIPKDKVNDYVYLSLPYGLPVNCMALGGNDIWKNCSFYTQETKLERITLKDAQGKIIRSYNTQEIDAKTYLDIYKNHPAAIPVDVMDMIQGRILLTDDFLLNPSSGVKIYRYMTIDPNKLESYKKELRAIVARMMETARSKSSISEPRRDEPLSKQLALTTPREYEKATESLLKKGQELLLADPTVENVKKAHDFFIRLSTMQKVYGPLYGADVDSQQKDSGELFYQNDVEKLLNALAFKFGLNDISPYTLWKQKKVEEWNLSRNFDNLSQRKLDLLESIGRFGRFDPEHILKTQKVLYSYNFLRELSGLKPVLDFSAIDFAWLGAQDYQLWKDATQTVKKDMSIDSLVTLIFTFLDLYEISPIYFEIKTLHEYNYLRDLLHVPRAQSVKQISIPWLKKVQYKYWKKHQESLFQSTNTPTSQQKSTLRDQVLLSLKDAPSNSFRQREALYRYNFLRELEHLPPVQSWTDIDKASLSKEPPVLT